MGEGLTAVLVSYWDRRLMIDGKLFEPDSDIIVLAPLKHDEYARVEPESDVGQNSQKVIVDAFNRKITVLSAWFGEFMLFYHMHGENVVISSSFDDILAFIRSKNVICEPDHVAIFESLVLDCPIRDRTFCKQIKKTTPGIKLEVSLHPFNVKSSHTYIRKYFGGDQNPDGKLLLNQAAEILEGLFSSSDLERLNGRQVLLPLSGGNDSRLLACLLKKHGIEFDCITFGPVESADPFIAKRVAARLGIGVKHLILEDRFYKLFGDEVTIRSAGFSGHAHCHLYSVLKNIRSRSDFIVHSYAAEMSRATITDWSDDPTISRDRAMSRFMKEHVSGKPIWGTASEEIKENLVEDLNKVMDENCKVNRPQYFNDYLNKVDITSTLISSIFNVCESFGTLVRPFLSYDYQSFFTALPTRLRKERYLFWEACRRLFPHQFAIGTAEEMFPFNGVLKNLENGVFRGWHALSYGAFLASGGRLWIPNPKNYERHRKVLFGVLKEDLMNAIKHLESTLNIDLQSYSRVSHKNRMETTTQFRILSSSVILRHCSL